MSNCASEALLPLTYGGLGSGSTFYPCCLTCYLTCSDVGESSGRLPQVATFVVHNQLESELASDSLFYSFISIYKQSKQCRLAYGTAGSSRRNPSTRFRVISSIPLISSCIPAAVGVSYYLSTFSDHASILVVIIKASCLEAMRQQEQCLSSSIFSAFCTGARVYCCFSPTS